MFHMFLVEQHDGGLKLLSSTRYARLLKLDTKDEHLFGLTMIIFSIERLNEAVSLMMSYFMRTAKNNTILKNFKNFEITEYITHHYLKYGWMTTSTL